jgi:hypothetical protein
LLIDFITISLFIIIIIIDIFIIIVLGDYKEVWVIAKSNAAVGGVALCIAVPAILFLRFPFMLKFAIGK